MKLKGKAKARARAKAKKTHFSAKELFGKSTKWTEPDTAMGFTTGQAVMWDATGGKSPFAVFSQAHETKKLIKIIEEEPVKYSTKAIKQDWDQLLPEISKPRHAADMVAGYFMAILPSQTRQVGDKQVRGVLARPIAAGLNDSQWCDQLDRVREDFAITPLKDDFVLMASYCTPDRVWENFRKVTDHFHYAVVAFSNTIKFQVLAEDCHWQAVWNGKREFADVTDLGTPLVSKKLMEVI